MVKGTNVSGKRSETPQQSTLGGGRPVILKIVSVAPSLVKAEEEINFLAGEAGYSYADKLYPAEIFVIRNIYKGKPFENIAPLLKSHDWENAIVKLKEIAKTGDAKTARRAGQNLSVAYEASGNEEAAVYWMERAKRKK